MSALSDDDVDTFLSAHTRGIPWVELKSCRWGSCGINRVWELLGKLGMRDSLDVESVENLLQNMRTENQDAEELYKRLRGVKNSLEKCVSMFQENKRSPADSTKLIIPLLNESRFHFYLYVLQVQERGFKLFRYDSLGSLSGPVSRTDHVVEVMAWMCKRMYAGTDFEYEDVVNTFVQGNNLKCGAFTCAYALLVALDLDCFHGQLDSLTIDSVYELIAEFFLKCEEITRNDDDDETSEDDLDTSKMEREISTRTEHVKVQKNCIDLTEEDE